MFPAFENRISTSRVLAIFAVPGAAPWPSKMMVSGVCVASRYCVSFATSASRAAAEWRGAPGASSGQLCSRL